MENLFNKLLLATRELIVRGVDVVKLQGTQPTIVQYLIIKVVIVMNTKDKE